MSSFGLYIHVPYCKRICPYCDFNVVRDRSSSSNQWPTYFSALAQEWNARQPLMQGTVRTLYFGGGTPSLAPPDLLAQFIGKLRASIEFDSELEITLEADPGTCTKITLNQFKEAGINRLSMGWQSTDDSLLKILGRNHQAEENKAIYTAARQVGFDNISVDFMFALPGQTMKMLDTQLDEVIDASPEHISLYALTYHEGTPFERWRQSGKLIAAPDDLEAEMMSRIEERLEKAGYVHYEVSNYARPGFESNHNQAYWTGIPYLGLGPGANSFIRDHWESGKRFESIRNVDDYTAYWTAQGSGVAPIETSSEWIEELSRQQLFYERWMLGLRTKAGICLEQFDSNLLTPPIDQAIQSALDNKWVVQEGTYVRPTALGMQFADSLGALFF